MARKPKYKFEPQAHNTPPEPSKGFKAYRARQHAFGPEGRQPRANAHRRAEVTTYKAKEATRMASESGDPSEHRKAANAHKVAAAANRNAGNASTATLHDKHVEAHQASVKAYQASGTKAVYDGSPAANRKAAHLHQVALDKHAAIGNHDAVSGHEAAGQEHSSAAEPIHKPPRRGGGLATPARDTPGEGSLRGHDRIKANALSAKADAASAATHGKWGAEGAKAHTEAAAAHRAASFAHRTAGNTDKAIEHSSKAGGHELNSKIEHGRTQGPGYTREAIAHGNHEYIRAGEKPKPFSNTHDQHAATANARNATAQAHAREGSSDKHLAASDHRIAATAHGNAANKYMYGSKEYQSHVASAEYHQGKARELETRNPTTAAGSHVPGHPDYTRAQGASTHAATQSARAHAKPSLVSHSLAAKAHDQAAAAHEHGSAAHEQHTKLAAEHRLEARKHSLKALAARKIGPGQKHGFHGQFEGVPGGAK